MAIQRAALYHRSGLEYRYFQDGQIHIRLMAQAGDLTDAAVLYDQKYVFGPRGPMQEVPMEKAASDGVHDWFEAAFLPKDPRLIYVLRVSQGEETLFLHASGIYPALRDNREEYYLYPSVLAGEEHLVPDWARGAVVYQIFVDRFHRVGEEAPGLAPWGAPPTRATVCGGNLRGIAAKADYLKELGVDVIYLTPIFVAGSNHRYDTIDYFRIDPLVGTLEDLKALSQQLHQRGMRLVLDGVFNHCSLKFFAFASLMEQGEASPYANWFLAKSYPVNPAEKNYDSFSHGPGMPKLNMNNPETRAYFLEVGRYWIREADVDGWRLDVANEIDTDFLRMFRQAVKAEKPDALIIGESWTDSFQWLQGDQFDGVMHYPMTFALRDFFQAEAGTPVEEMDARVQRAAMLYSAGAAQASWVMLDSHDTSRLLTLCGGEVGKLQAALLLQFALPGAPLLYYGDEVALEGGEDPDCRRCMPWERTPDHPVLDYVRRLCGLRRLPALRQGGLRVEGVADGVYVFSRVHPAGDVLCVVNVSGQERRLDAQWVAKRCPAGTQERLWGLDVRAGLCLRAWQGVLLVQPQRQVELHPLRAADFRQHFPPEYREWMAQFLARYAQTGGKP